MRLLIILSLFSLGCSSNQKLRLAEDELTEYFGFIDTREVPDHEIVYIDRITSAKTARTVTRELIGEQEISLKLRAFDEDLHLEVAVDKKFLSAQQTTSCVYLEDNGIETREDIARDCYYSGSVKGHSNSKVTINTCAGISGTISREGHADVYIEPLRHTHAQKRGMDSGLGHVVYSAPKDIGMWECGVGEEHGEVHKMADMPNLDVRTLHPGEKYAKLHIVADHQYWAAKGDDSCRCITATFQALAHRMALLPGLNMLLAKVTIIKSNTTLDTNDHTAGTNLELTRTWVHNHTDKAQWDLVALVVPMYMDVAGVAWVCSVCAYNKISVNYIGALYGVQVMAHEIGHNHTTGGRNCGNDGYVMGAAGYAEHEMGFAQCSIQKYLQEVNGFSCLNDP